MAGITGYSFEGFVFWSGVNALEYPDGKTINPSLVLCDLLLVFIRNPEADLSFSDLIKESGSPFNLSKDTLFHRIYALRNLIESNPGEPKIIEKLHGVGFRFNAGVKIIELVDRTSQSAIIESKYAERERRIEILEGENRALKNLIALSMLISLSEQERAQKVFDIVLWASKRLIGPEQETHISTLEMIDDYIQEAFSHYRKKSSDLELELAVNLSRFWNNRGMFSKGSRLLQDVLSRQSETVSDTQAIATAWLSNLLYHQANYKQAEQAASEGIRMSKLIGNDESHALSLFTLAMIAESEGRYSQARSYFTDCLQGANKAGIDWLISWVYLELGILARDQEDCSSAEYWFLKSMATREEIEDAHGLALVRSFLSGVTCAQGNIKQAKIWNDRSMENQRNKKVLDFYYSNLGLIEEASGNYAASLDYFLKALALRCEMNTKRGQARTLEGMARVAMAQGDDKESAGLFGAADFIRKSISAPLSPAERRSYGPLIIDARKRNPKEFETGSNATDDVIRMRLT